MSKFLEEITATLREWEKELYHLYMHHLIWHCPVGHVDHEFEACIEKHPCHCPLTQAETELL